MGEITYKDGWSYTIKENGYEIFGPGNLWITQFDQYSKIYVPDGTFEENCLAQLKTLVDDAVTPDEEPVNI